MKTRTTPLGKACIFLAIAAALWGTASCASRPGVAAGVPLKETAVLKRIAVLPFVEIAPDETSGRSGRCPVCGALFSAEAMPVGSAGVVEGAFHRRIEAGGRFDLVPTDRTQAVYQRLEAENLKQTPRQLLQAVGQDLAVEGVVAGYVYRFRERKGYPYAAERPASVAFEIHLIRVSDGASLWRGSYDHTQASLMENILHAASFYREKGRWVSAAELADEGMEGVLQTFPGLN
jgi:hypothetical protein